MKIQTKAFGAQALRESLFDNIPDGLAYCQTIFDASGNPIDFLFIQVNANFEKLTGLKDVIGKNVTKLVPGIVVSNPELFEICGRVSLTGRPERFETSTRSASRWFFVSAYSPQREFFVAVFQDITGRKEIDKNLENAKIAARNVLEDLSIEKSKVEMAQAKEEAILLSIGDGLIATDETGNIILINKTAESLLGKKSAEVIGKTFSQAIRIENEKGTSIQPEKHPASMALATGIITSTTTAGLTYYYVRKDATRFPVAIMVTPVILEGKVIGTIEIFRDITREKEIDRAKSEFVSLASHQLRTPPTSMNWYLEMLLKEDVGQLNTKQKSYLKEVYENNKRMISLINALLNISRMEMGTLEVEAQQSNLPALVAEIVRELQPNIQDKQLKLIQNIPEDLSVFLDPKLFVIIMTNLISNSVKYTPARGSITITVAIKHQGEKLDTRKMEDDNVVITVSDTGYGIPKAQQDKIFTKLFRADNIKIKDTDGTGLGLYLVKLIVDYCHGNIWFNSEENRGSTFFITLPIKGAQK